MEVKKNKVDTYAMVSKIFKLTPDILNEVNFNILIRFIKDCNYKAPYPEITSYVYRESENYEFSHTITSTEDALTLFLDKYSNENDDDEDNENLKKFVDKFISHATLAHVQYQHFKRQIEEANDLLSEIKKSRDNIYTDFIAILGVFSSFVFVMFSGFSGLTAILTNLGGVSVSITRTVFISAVLMAFIISIIYVLLLWVSRIIGKDISGKPQLESEQSVKGKVFSIYFRHRFYLSIMIILFILSVVSFTLIVFGIN